MNILSNNVFDEMMNYLNVEVVVVEMRKEEKETGVVLSVKLRQHETFIFVFDRSQNFVGVIVVAWLVAQVVAWWSSCLKKIVDYGSILSCHA